MWVKPHKVNKLQMRLSYCRIYFNIVCNMKNTNNLTQIKMKIRDFSVKKTTEKRRVTSSNRATIETTQAAQKAFFPDLASRQMKTKLFFSSQAGKQNLKFWRLHMTH